MPTRPSAAGQLAPLAGLPGVALLPPGRVVLMGLAVAFVAAAFPFLPLPVLLPVWAALGVMAALPGAANAAIRRGRMLGVYASASPLRWLRQGPWLRLGLHGALGMVAVLVLLTRLAGGGAAVWLASVLVVLVVLLVLRRGGGLLARHFVAVHREAALRRLALFAGVAAMLLASGLWGWVLGVSTPLDRPSASSALIDEALALHGLWLGIELWLLGEAAALDLLPPWAESLLAVVFLSASGWAMAALVVAAAMRGPDMVRALGPAADDAVPPVPGVGAFLAIAVLVLLVGAAALGLERRLAVQEPASRPVGQLQTVAERIGIHFHPPGTHARVAAGRDRLVALDAATMAEMRMLADAGFDAMLTQVDPFLDGYYTLSAEYWRISVAVHGLLRGDAEGALARHLEGQLVAALNSDRHLRPLIEAVGGAGLAEARTGQAAREQALLSSPIATLNPALLRVEAEFPAFAPLPELRSLGLSSQLETRLGFSGAVGLLGAVVARRVLRQLARQGVLRLAARGFLTVLPLLGTAVAVGADQVALKLEEYYNRADFRAEIIAAIEQQRAEVLAALD